MIARYSFLFFVVMGFIVVPFLSYFLCSKLLNRRYGRRVGLGLACVIIGLVICGMTFGFSQLQVRQIEFASKDLPEAFDGYRIVQFSDAHVDTFEGWLDEMLPRIVDSINAQKADMIVFTGDLQNLRPDELVPKVPQLRQLHAPDGVYSILGNHDYATYLDCDEATKKQNDLKTQQLERQMGWTLLMNEHRIIRRGSDSIVIAGMENWGVQKRMPRNGDVGKTMKGVSPKSFTVMLQHDPNAWRAKILPECNAQLTLSGHTHGGQFSLFGWTPANFTYSECFGTYYEGDRAICVSSGLGGIIPFRLGQPGEIVVITLRKK
jgi:predicted MPP superfamily phosphohydrolase